MNPYDFARIDWDKHPVLKKPLWHNRFAGNKDQPVYSGQLEVDIDVLTPLFIVDPRDDPADDREPARSLKNENGDYIIPGSSLKGLLRNLVETLGNGCLTLFDGEYDRRQVNYRHKVDRAFQHCRDNTQLCIACRTFGMLNEREGRGNVFLGKVNISDAIANYSVLYDPFYTGVLVEPKPRHSDFYLDEPQERIAGRKFYFHHSPNGRPISTDKPQWMGGKPANRYIEPLARDTQFHFRIDFTNLEEDEFGALLLAVVLEEDMRHKIGYGKPLGMGSVELIPTKLTLIDYSTRYTNWQDGQGKTVFVAQQRWDEIGRHLDIFYDNHLQELAMEDLRRIWRFPPEAGTDYYYPSKRDWFDKPISKGKRIADTRGVPRQR